MLGAIGAIASASCTGNVRVTPTMKMKSTRIREPAAA